MLLATGAHHSGPEDSDGLSVLVRCMFCHLTAVVQLLEGTATASPDGALRPVLLLLFAQVASALSVLADVAGYLAEHLRSQLQVGGVWVRAVWVRGVGAVTGELDCEGNEGRERVGGWNSTGAVQAGSGDGVMGSEGVRGVELGRREPARSVGSKEGD